MKENKYFRIFIRPTRYKNTKRNDFEKKKNKNNIIYPQLPITASNNFFLLLIKLNKYNPMK